MKKKISVSSAIGKREKITFVYHGEERSVEPHVLGKSGGKMQVLTYSPAEGWKRFNVDEMKKVKRAKGKVKRRDDGAPYAPFDEVIKVVK